MERYPIDDSNVPQGITMPCVIHAKAYIINVMQTIEERKKDFIGRDSTQPSLFQKKRFAELLNAIGYHSTSVTLTLTHFRNLFSHYY